MDSAPLSPVIRSATVEDADSIGLIHRVGRRMAVAEALPAVELQATAAQHAEEWRHWLRLHAVGRATGFVMVADSRQGVAGFVCAIPPRVASGVGPWLVQHLYVLPAFQGRGLGRRLEQAAVERMRKAGVQQVELVTFADTPHQRFHASQGWRVIGEETISLRGMQTAGLRYGLSLPEASPEGLSKPEPVGGVSQQGPQRETHQKTPQETSRPLSADPSGERLG